MIHISPHLWQSDEVKEVTKLLSSDWDWAWDWVLGLGTGVQYNLTGHHIAGCAKHIAGCAIHL